MTFYKPYLRQQNHEVTYIETTDERNDIRKLIRSLSKQKITFIQIEGVIDNWLSKRLIGV